MRRLLAEHPDMPATVVAERLEWQGSITWFRDNIRRLRPEHRPVDPADRLAWAAGDAAQCDLWFPPQRIPREDATTVVLPVLVIVATHSRFLIARMIPTTADHRRRPQRAPAPNAPCIAVRRLLSMNHLDRRLLLVHARPDDETIQSGLAMARYAAEGAGVTLVTCTLGEEGEVLIPALAHLASSRDDSLGKHRIAELAAAMKILGVTDHRFLGGAGHYRDSGMVYDENGYATAPAEVKAGTFWRADLLEAAEHLIAVIREVRPQVLVCYDEFGNYGHPDHVQAHRVAMYAAQLAGISVIRPDLGEAWTIAKTFWTANSESEMRGWLRELRASGDTTTFAGADPDGDLGIRVTADADLSARIHAPALAPRKVEAMLAHASQITPDGPFFQADGMFNAWQNEYYILVDGTPGPIDPATGLENDLFAGIA